MSSSIAAREAYSADQFRVFRFPVSSSNRILSRNEQPATLAWMTRYERRSASLSRPASMKPRDVRSGLHETLLHRDVRSHSATM